MSTMTLEDVRATRPAADEYAPYYGTYVGRVADGDIVQTLASQVDGTLALLRSIPESRAGHRYAQGKWSIRELVGHVCDTERIFAYRALRFARGDQTPLPGYDENEFVANSRLDQRTLGSLVAEFEVVRRGTRVLLDNLFADEWVRRGNANGKEMTVRAMAWIIAGHELHHMGILKERYLG